MDQLFIVVKCLENHRLPWGGIGIKYGCQKGDWIPVDETNINVSGDDHCRPYCSRPCLNGGWCVGPGLCKCAEGFLGSQCERSELLLKF